MEDEGKKKRRKRRKKPEPEVLPEREPEVAPKPPAPPLKPEPAMSKSAKETYNYLKKHGAASPLRIARDLSLDRSTVMKALKELQSLGKVKLSA